MACCLSRSPSTLASWRRAGLCLLSLLGLACTKPPSPPPLLPSSELALTQGWQEPDPTRGSQLRELRFLLDPTHLGGEAALELDDAQGRVTVTVNGRPIPPVEAGIGPTRIELGTALRPGWNTLRVEAESPGQRHPLLTGGPPGSPSPGLEPRLLLHPAVYVSTLALPLLDHKVEPVLSVKGGVPGMRASLVISVDGRLLQRWDPIPVQAGTTTFPSKRWRGPLWAPSQASRHGLVQATVLLQANDELIDARSLRVGVRDFQATNKGFELDGESMPLLAVRVDPSHPLPAQARDSVTGGVNALELHGQSAPDSFLSTLDELGMPLVLMPRCDGRIWLRDGSTAHFQLAAQATEVARQDRALITSLLDHPSLLLWACEGSQETTRELCATLREDPLGRPVAGVDVEVDVAPRSAGHDPGARVWIAEIAGGSGQGRISTAGREFLEQARPGGYGGVILPPPSMSLFIDEWRETWREVAKELHAQAWDPAPRRASSRVIVSGLEAYAAVWLEAPWLSARGAVADDRGRAEIQAWHVGPALLRSGQKTLSIELKADTWHDFVRKAQALEVAWPR